MENFKGFNLMGSIKRRTNFQLAIAACTFVFSCIVLGIGVAYWNNDLDWSNDQGKIAGIIFAIFDFGACVAMLSLWISLYNRLAQMEVVRRVVAGSLAIFSIILAFIACVVIVDILDLASLANLENNLSKGGWEAMNGLVVAFTGIGLIMAILTCILAHKASKRVDNFKEQVTDAFLGDRAPTQQPE